MEKNDGGPAFPRIPMSNEKPEDCKGMSLRDYFAGKALQGLLAGARSEKLSYLAEWAYNYADAMLAERKKR